MAPPPAAAAAARWAAGAAQFVAGLEPYKRLGAVVIRETCASVAVSNPYLNLSERAGGIMLRQGRVPARSLQVLVTKAVAPDALCGWVIGCERGTAAPGLLPPDRAATLAELLRALDAIAPGMPLCWHARPASEGPSCRIYPGAPRGGGGGGGLAECNVGGEFLQSFLDSLGGLNTFG
ncbi:MAG: hypothetical protein J3K34DRAFT_524626 [Monoraphidium minutum]|nr:MAG: hypothetical protein J3K34DRAFT_524626 [Monoraphidium minutum]